MHLNASGAQLIPNSVGGSIVSVFARLFALFEHLDDFVVVHRAGLAHHGTAVTTAAAAAATEATATAAAERSAATVRCAPGPFSVVHLNSLDAELIT